MDKSFKIKAYSNHIHSLLVSWIVYENLQIKVDNKVKETAEVYLTVNLFDVPIQVCLDYFDPHEKLMFLLSASSKYLESSMHSSGEMSNGSAIVFDRTERLVQRLEEQKTEEEKKAEEQKKIIGELTLRREKWLSHVDEFRPHFYHQVTKDFTYDGPIDSEMLAYLSMLEDIDAYEEWKKSPWRFPSVQKVADLMAEISEKLNGGFNLLCGRFKRFIIFSPLNTGLLFVFVFIFLLFFLTKDSNDGTITEKYTKNIADNLTLGGIIFTIYGILYSLLYLNCLPICVCMCLESFISICIFGSGSCFLFSRLLLQSFTLFILRMYEPPRQTASDLYHSSSFPFSQQRTV